jgi:UDP-N-acetylmuramate dehydrogenase
VFKNPENSERGAGRLIEAAGLKGFRVGGAQVSLKHANFILNTGNATSADIENLITHIQSEVKKRFNIALELELVIIGEQ